MLDRQIINSDMFSFPSPQNIRTSHIYILPKIHKSGVPWRPIVSSCGASTDNISLYVDDHLGALVKTLPSYIKDTNDFLCKLQYIWNLPAESLLVTLHVVSLYNNILDNKGMDSCREKLNTKATLVPPINDWIQLMNLILEKKTIFLSTDKTIYKYKEPQWDLDGLILY